MTVIQVAEEHQQPRWHWEDNSGAGTLVVSDALRAGSCPLRDQDPDTGLAEGASPPDDQIAPHAGEARQSVDACQVVRGWRPRGGA